MLWLLCTMQLQACSCSQVPVMWPLEHAVLGALRQEVLQLCRLGGRELSMSHFAAGLH